MRSKIYRSLVAVTLVAVLAVLGCAPAAAPVQPMGKPIVIGYCGQVADPGTKPCMDAQKMAVDEINEAGGILGRPVKYVIGDTKGETPLMISAVTRMILDYKVLAYFTEVRSELCLAARQRSLELYPEYPHIAIMGGVTPELTEGVVSDYDKFKFIFRSYEACQLCYCYGDQASLCDIVGAKKVGILYDDLMWTKLHREGDKALGYPSEKEYFEKQRGIEVVYEKAVKLRTGMYLPILEELKNSGAEACFTIMCFFADTEVLAKQWAESSARDMQLIVAGGPASSYSFWDLTGGKGLGAITWHHEAEIPFTEKTIPFLRKARERRIPVSEPVCFAYDDIYLFKAAIEEAGTTDDIDAIIKALETTKITGILGRHGYHSERIEPHFHSHMTCDLEHPFNYAPGVYSPWGQWQGPDNVVILLPAEFGHPELYKTPAQLREEAGW